MADNNEKVLPVVRLLLIAFFALLLVLAVQLFLLLTRDNSTPRIQGVGQHRLVRSFSPLHEDRFSAVQIALLTNRE